MIYLSIFFLCIFIYREEDKKSLIIIIRRYYVKTLRLLTLKKNDYDTNAKPIKETFLTVENGSFHVFGPKSMINEKEWSVNIDIQFNIQAILNFFDEDSIRNLSTTKEFIHYIVKEEHEIYNNRLGRINFVTNTTNYVLNYKIL